MKRAAKKRRAPLPADLSIFTTEQAAAFLQCSTQRLEIWRCHGGGPPYAKLGRLVRYRREDLLSWVAGRMMRATGDAVRAPASP